MRLGIFGGSFNPPHLGHLRAAQYFQSSLELDEVLVIPAKEPPLKATPTVSGEDRLELCKRTFPFPVSDIELRRPGTSYTVDTLRDLRVLYPEARFFLLIGEDQREQFHLWKDWEEILRLADLFVLPRAGEGKGGFTPIEVSSTRLRETIANGGDASRWLSAQTCAYIRENLLYREPDLPPERLYHSKCVADAAEMLARKYQADRRKARLAGLWHDCGKYLPKPEPVTPQSHAFAGAEFLERHMGVTDPEVLSAVRWHTTGHAGMTLLEEIIFVADLISADRTYPDVERTRSLAAQDLHAASKYILEFIIANLAGQGKAVHPDALAWYNELCAEEGDN